MMFLIGSLSTLIFLRVISFLQMLKLKSDYNKVFGEILNAVGTKSVKFLNRFNDTITFQVSTIGHGKLELIYFMDKKDISTFKDGSVFYTSFYADKIIIENICNKLDDFHDVEISDCVNILGVLVDKKTVMKLVPNQMIGFEDNTPKFTIDGILDRISQVGIQNLTKEENDFLTEYHKTQN